MPRDFAYFRAAWYTAPPTGTQHERHLAAEDPVTPTAQQAKRQPQSVAMRIARYVAALAALVLFGTFFLISPPASPPRPGVETWQPYSPLRFIIDAMALNHSVRTVGGDEIKTWIVHGGAAVALLLAAIVRWQAPLRRGWRSALRRPWFAGQLLMLGWVGLALLSGLWSSAPAMSVAQGLAYALLVAWAVGLAWTLDPPRIEQILKVLVGLTAAASVLTIWYYLERAPTHRPGFPFGNPGVLAAIQLPALLIGASVLLRHARNALTRGQRPDWRGLIPITVALVPIGMAFWLADALAAKVGLLAGLLIVALAHLPRRARWWVIIGGGGVALALVSWRFSQSEELALGRGASARFRLYTWNYAATLWQRAPYVGFGAAIFPRAANELARTDRLLDPAAIGDELIGHAHNELFEIFAEIGLIGGVTFVGAHVATALTLLYLFRRRRASWQAPWCLGLAAAYVALIAESFGNVALRLPGVPAVFYLLVGMIWAWGRQEDRPQTLAEELEGFDAPARARRKRRLAQVSSVGLGLAAVGVAVVGFANYVGATSAAAAETALREGDPKTALQEATVARALQLDPVDRIFAAWRAIQAREQQAESAARAFVAAAQQGEATRAQRDAVAATLVAVYQSAHELNALVPSYGALNALAARIAESLHNLYRDDPRQAAAWRERAFERWLTQRQEDLYHVPTLLTLTRYPGTTQQHTVMLRDALRRAAVTRPAWQAALARLAARPDFTTALARLEAVAGPVVPETEITAIISSFAPETRRLLAAWHARAGRFAEAADQAERAAALYRSMRSRFPALPALALAEAAEYRFRSAPADPTVALALIERALASLPPIQPDQRLIRARPLVRQQARYLLAAGREAEADEVLARIVPDSAQRAALLAELAATLPADQREAEE